MSGGQKLAERHSVPYRLRPEDADNIGATPIEDQQTITVGSVVVSVIHTPGHSPGGVTYDVNGEALLPGDTLFHESVGRVELGVEAGLEEANVEENAEFAVLVAEQLFATGCECLSGSRPQAKSC